MQPMSQAAQADDNFPRLLWDYRVRGKTALGADWLTNDLKCGLKSYRLRKSALYPWVWW